MTKQIPVHVVNSILFLVAAFGFAFFSQFLSILALVPIILVGGYILITKQEYSKRALFFTVVVHACYVAVLLIFRFLSVFDLDIDAIRVCDRILLCIEIALGLTFLVLAIVSYFDRTGGFNKQELSKEKAKIGKEEDESPKN